MPIVTMPDGKVVDLPENLSPEDMALLDKVHGTGSGVDEAGRVADKVVRGGIFALPNLVRSVVKYGQKKQEERLAKPGYAESLTGLIEQANPINQLLRVREPEFLTKAYDAVTKPNEPKTATGKTVGNVGEAVVGTFAAPGGLVKPVQSLIQGLSSGAGGEIGARILGGEDGDSPVGRVVGAILGGLSPAVARKVIPNSDSLIKQAGKEVTEADLRHAKELKKISDENGIPTLTSQLLGERSTLADLVSSASSRPSIRPKILSYMSQASNKVQSAFDHWRDSNLPYTVNDPKTVIGDVQGLAENRIKYLYGRANQEYTNNLPKGVSASTYDAEYVKDIAKKLREASMDPDYFGPNTGGGDFLRNTAARLEAAASQKSSILDASGNATSLPVPKGYVNNQLKELNTNAVNEGYSGKALGISKDILSEGTPEFADARKAMGTFIEKSVNPVEKSLLGQLAQMGGGVRPDKVTAKTTALSMLLPKSESQAFAIKQLSKDLGPEGPRAVGELTREYLSRAMNDAVELSTSSGKTQQPFSFVRAVAGTKAQRDNLDTALIESAKGLGANPFAVRNGFYKLLKSLDSFKDLKITASVDKTALGQQASSNFLGKVTAPQTGIRRWRDFITSEKTFQKIADMVMSPDGLEQFEKIAKTQDPSIIGRYAASLITSANKLELEDQAQPTP